MFRTVPLSIIRSFSLYTQQWYTSYSFADSLRAGSGRNCSSVLILLESCMTYTVAVCTVENCWWWTEELSETCRVSSSSWPCSQAVQAVTHSYTFTHTHTLSHTHSHTLTICNTYCFPTAKMVTRTRLNITFLCTLLYRNISPTDPVFIQNCTLAHTPSAGASTFLRTDSNITVRPSVTTLMTAGQALKV